MIRLDYPWADKLYKAMVAAGILMLVAAAWLFAEQWAQFERRASVVYELMIMSSIEIDSLNRELRVLEQVVQGEVPTRGGSMDGEAEEMPQYSEAQVAQLMLELGALNAQLQEKSGRYTEAALTRDALFQQLLVSIVLAIAAVVAAVILLLLGALGWRYRIQIFEDRRKGSRAGESS